MRIVAKDLLPGRTYRMQFRSKNAGEVSEWGHSFAVTIDLDTAKPLPPTGVTLESIGDSFQARWSPVTHSDDGSPATDLVGYVAQFRNVVTNQTATFETQDTSFELTFNLNFAMFTPIAGQVGVKVAAKNNMGIQGEWSEEVITQNPPPGPVRNLVAEGVTDAISATWEPPANLEDDFKEYRAFVGTTENFPPSTPAWIGVGTSAIYYTSTKVNHWFKVMAYDKFGSASTVVTAGPVMPKSSVEADIVAPDTPTNLSGDIEDQRLTVSWTPPANPDNDLAGYQIGYRPAGQTGWSYATASHEDTSFVIEPIIRYTNYEIKIQAHDFSFNYSPWSANTTVTGETNTPPATPTGVQVKGAITSAMVLWNANTDIDLAGYEVQFKASSAPVDADPVFPTTARTMSFSEDVTQDTTYYARVRAVDNQGLKSAWSAAVSGVVGFVPPVEPSDGEVPSSSPTAVLSKGVGAIYARWNPVANNDPVIYEVHLGTTTGFTAGSATKIGDTSSTFATIQKLPNDSPLIVGTTYYVKLIAKDVDGPGPVGAASNGVAIEYVPTQEDIDGLDGRLDDTITDTTVQYAVSSSETVPPTTGWSADTPTRTPGSYIWFRTVLTYGDGSGATSNPALLTGNDGAQGDQGIPGDPGDDGQSLYTWLKYADTPTTGMADVPDGKTYMGVAYNKTTQTESSNYADYQWSLIKGADGIPGEPGADGETTYTWVKYADSAAGAGMSDSPTGKTYIGLAFNKPTATESSTATDYQWSLIQGEPGSDGVSITGIQPFFRVVTKGATAPAQPTGTADPSGWTTTEPEFTMDTELYRTERITYSNSTASWTPVTKVSSYTGIDEVNTIAITADRRVRKSTVAPTASDAVGAPEGALWYVYGAATSPGTGTVLQQTYELVGSTWQPRGIDRTFIPAIDIGDGTFGTLTGGRLVANSVTAAQIDTDDLTANSAFINSLTVNAANIQGTLTIGQLPSDIATDGDIDTAVDPINNTIDGWVAGTGTTLINGGIILTDSIGALQIRTEEIAADQAFLNNLVVTNGNISNLDANKLTAGTGLITDLTVKSTLTLGDDSNNGVIQSHGFSGTTAGFKIDKSGVVINEGTIEARTLNIQTGQNLLKPEFADFELPDSFYNSSNLTIVGNVTTTAVAGGRFNNQKLQVRSGGFNTQWVYFGTSTADYNIPVEGGKNYIVSAYVAGGDRTSNFSMRVRWSNGSYNTLASTTIAASSAFQRVSDMVTAPAGVTGAILSVYGSSTVSNSGWDIDGLQFEEQFGALSTPSPWTPPGVSSIDGGMIRTGEIRSNTNITVNGVSQPMWSINMAGGMQIGSAVIRGNLTVGATSDAAGSVIQSSNYVAGVSGFVMRGSDGFAEFQNLLVNLNSTTPGQIIVGTLDQGGQTIITGGAGGGVKFFIPEADAAVAEFGRNVLARNAEGETVASMGDDGVVSGQTGIFENLTVAGTDVTERVTRDDSAVVVLDDTGTVGTGYGPYTTETGFREVGFFAEPNRLYKVENWVHVKNVSTSSGTFFSYLRYTMSSGPTTNATAPLVSSDELSSNDGAISINAEGRFFNTGYIYANSSGQNVRLLITARGGGGRDHTFVRSRFAVTDLGIYDPLVTSGRFSRGGAPGTPVPAPEPPPQLYKKWYDFSWEEVYQISGAAAHGSGGLGSKARMGRVGSTSNYPWGTMLGLPSALVSDLSGATVKKAGIRLTSLSWMDGAVISGYATASSAPANMPTTPSGASNIGTLPKGATKTLWLPSSYYTTLRTSSRALTLGRLNSSGYNDTFIETANISASTGTRPRLYVEYVK